MSAGSIIGVMEGDSRSSDYIAHMNLGELPYI